MLRQRGEERPAALALAERQRRRNARALIHKLKAQTKTAWLQAAYALTEVQSWTLQDFAVQA